MKLFDHQLKALRQIHHGCILVGGVGSGKSLTSLAYFYIRYGGSLKYLKGEGEYTKPNMPDLYIITTARKRDTHEWDKELTNFHMSALKPEYNEPDNKIVIDSWNNIKKYKDVTNSIFIFDEQRVVGYGAWTKSFLKIAKNNQWILLSATPGDTWTDYIPVFVANGFYRNKTEFNREHLIFSNFGGFPKIEKVLNTGRLLRLRNKILVDMDFNRPTMPHHIDIYTEYDKEKYKSLLRLRWNPWEEKPIDSASELCYGLRRVANEDDSRAATLLDILEKHPRAIIFYNFNYELDILRNLYYGEGVEIAEWNGCKHQEIPKGDKWVYLVQYTAGAEGWNCITTDTIIFYSQNYSYKTMIQASGRIDRLNTKYIDLYYYHFKSHSSIDIAISKTLKEKKKFNERRFVDGRK